MLSRSGLNPSCTDEDELYALFDRGTSADLRIGEQAFTEADQLGFFNSYFMSTSRWRAISAH